MKEIKAQALSVSMERVLQAKNSTVSHHKVRIFIVSKFALIKYFSTIQIDDKETNNDLIQEFGARKTECFSGSCFENSSLITVT